MGIWRNATSEQYAAIASGLGRVVVAGRQTSVLHKRSIAFDILRSVAFLLVILSILLVVFVGLDTLASERTPKDGDVITGDLTHYCSCAKCCGKSDGVTASGMSLEDDSFVVAANWLPFGSVVEINGVEYTVADRGGKSLNAIGRLDVYVPDGHQAALRLGRKKDVDVTIVHVAESE